MILKLNKLFILCVIFLLLGMLALPVCAFAQTAKIVELRGEVFVRESQDVSWMRAKINTFLNKKSELKTEEKASCTLAFDEEMKNVLKIGENSQIKIESIKPGNIFLNRGRVFSLVESSPTEERFQVRTPVAIAGARGTGWLTAHDKETIIQVFEDIVVVQGLDQDGNIISQEDLESGFGLGIGADGGFSERFVLSEADYERWSSFIDKAAALLGQIREQQEQGKYDSSMIDKFLQEIGDDFIGSLGSLSEEKKEDLKDLVDEKLRKKAEDSQDCSGNDSNNGEGQYLVAE